MSIKLGILGYGNIGRGIESAILQNDDMELAAVFTRRDPASVDIKTDVPVVRVEDIEAWQDKIDVMILCGGSAFRQQSTVDYQRKTYKRVFCCSGRGCRCCYC